MKKFIFLILTLAIPVSIFLFLKIFGDNEFEVPVLFGEGIPGCIESSSPHEVPSIRLLLPDSSIIGTDAINGYIIYGYLSQKDQSNLRRQIIQLVRIQDAFYETGSPTFVLLTEDQEYFQSIQIETSDLGLQRQAYFLGVIQNNGIDEFMKCGLGINNASSTKLVMVDTEKRIRGIYEGLEMEQTEQLILELKILRKQS